ncbi:MAG: TrkA C-terminal domain-containing protein, partial [Nitrospiraceae bacterium]
LSLRTAAIERFPVVQGSPVVGKTLAEMALPLSIRLVTVLRGPFLVPPDDALILRVNDVLVIIGLQGDLAKVASSFAPARHVQSS